MIDENYFNELADKWRYETCHHSNSSMILNNENCRKIAAMGKEVIPLCLKRLKGDDSHSWCLLLHELSDENPVKPEMAGYVKACVKAWLEWGSLNFQIESSNEK